MRLYAQEQKILANPRAYSTDYISWAATRRNEAERIYRGELVKYARATYGKVEGAKVEKRFKKGNPLGRGQLYRDYLLRLFPTELN
jgi:hypothetical protein